MTKENCKLPKIKICGLTKKEEAAYLNEIEADYAGFVFFEKSKRNISFEKASEIMKELNPKIQKVAVIVSPDEEMIEKLNNSEFDIVQVHGDITLERLQKIKKPIWRAINIQGNWEEHINELNLNIEKTSDGQGEILLDGKEKSNGNSGISGILIDSANFGSGKTFEWEKVKGNLSQGILDNNSSGKRWRPLFILAGGLNSENVREGIEIFKPDVVDVSSGVEGENGKDRTKILEFAKAVRKIKASP